MTSTKLPSVIPLSAIDRSFLIPETDDPYGPYFPMCLVCGLVLRSTPTQADVVEALAQVVRKFPQLRLGYRLDFARNRLVHVPDDQLERHLAGMVHQGEPTSDLVENLTRAISTNNMELANPAEILLAGNTFLFKMHHCIGDARFWFHLISYVLLALADPSALQRLPELPMNFGLSLTRLVWQSPVQAAGVTLGWLTSFARYYREFQHDMRAPAPTDGLSPIVTGSPMGVCLRIVPAEVIDELKRLRAELSKTAPARITQNTLLHVLIRHRLVELGLEKGEPIYLIPVDLRRYLRNPATFYPGNFVDQIRVRPSARQSLDFRSDCIEIQQQVNRQLKYWGPLSAAPSLSLLALNDKMFRRLNRDWLLKSIDTDQRTFVLSNVGPVDPWLKPIRSLVDVSHGLFAAWPLTGGLRLGFGFATYDRQGYLSTIYDPRDLSAEQVEHITDMFSHDWLQRYAEK